jgi:hypothetical protein
VASRPLVGNSPLYGLHDLLDFGEGRTLNESKVSVVLARDSNSLHGKELL